MYHHPECEKSLLERAEQPARALTPESQNIKGSLIYIYFFFKFPQFKKQWGKTPITKQKESQFFPFLNKEEIEE